jgi:hypothetical protein
MIAEGLHKSIAFLKPLPCFDLGGDSIPFATPNNKHSPQGDDRTIDGLSFLSRR